MIIQLRDRPRRFALPAARCVFACVLAHAGAAQVQAAVPDIERRDAAAEERLVVATLGDRWIVATNSPRRGVTRGKRGVNPPYARPVPASPRPRAAGPVVTAATTGPGQSGYVHYFVIEPAGGEPETQIGIELPDDRIAWSFPDLGVVVSPFIESGEILAGGKTYAVRHLYGLRPFPDEESMRVLQRDLWSRVIPWVEDETPYCSLGTQSGSCLSCLGFVLRVLYPPVSGGMPALPPDFESAGPAMYFSTGDLLLYQTGLHGNRSREERLRLIDTLNLPSRLRDDLVQLADALDPGDIAAPVPPAASKKTAASKRPAGRSYTRTGQQRPLPRKKL